MRHIAIQSLVTFALLGSVALAQAALAGCSEPAKSSASAGGASPGGGAASADSSDVRIVMSAAFVSESGVGVYEKIAEYLTRTTGVKAEFVSGLAYGTINSMIETGKVECGFICGYPYVLLRDRDQPAAELLVAPVMKAPRYGGKPKYFSDLIVKKDSPFQSLQDLKGRTYVYNDELSNSGYNMPRFRMLQLGLTDGFFGKVLRSGSHEESIRMVATGEADASYVDSLVIDYDREKHLGHADQVRVVESIGPAGVCPMVASSAMPAALRQKFQEQLARMHEDPEGRKILDEALIDRFVVVDDTNYDDIRSMKVAAEKAGFTTIR